MSIYLFFLVFFNFLKPNEEKTSSQNEILQYKKIELTTNEVKEQIESLKEKLPDSAYVINVELNPIIVGATTVLKNIFFETNSYALKDESKVELNKLIEFMTKNPTLKIQISGHTDDVGTDFDNQKLSENRAKSVYDYLVANGIVATRLTYKGYGETKPIAPNNSDENRALNRRTEFTVLAK